MRIPFSTHLGTKFMALVLGVILWGFAYMESFQDMPQKYVVVFRPPAGWRIEPDHTPITVVVKGPRRVVETIISPDMSPTIDKQIEPKDLEGQGDSQPMRISITRDDIPLAKGDGRVTFPNQFPSPQVIAFRETTVTLPVKVRVEGKPAPGYVFSEEDTQVWPTTIDVTGPKSVLEGVSAIYTDTVTLTGRWNMPPLQIPLDTSIAGPTGPVSVRTNIQQVTVQVGFKKELGTRTFDQVPVIAGVPSDYLYKVTLDPPAVRVVVQGPKQDVETLTAASIRVYADINTADLKPTETVPRLVTPEVTVPQGFTATVDPSRVGVTVTAK